MTNATFPTVTAYNLNRQRFNLPSDFEGTYNLLLLGFAMNDQYTIDSWLPLARDLAAAHPWLRYYELPIAGRKTAPERFWIDNGMRGGIPDPAVRHVTITIYQPQRAFMRALGHDDPRGVYAFVVDRAGAVYWQARGALTATHEADLRARLAQIELDSAG